MDNNEGHQISNNLESYRPLFDNSLDAIYIINSKGVIVECNKTAQILSRQCSEGLVGLLFHKCYPGKKINIDYTDLFNRLNNKEFIQPLVYNVAELNNEIWLELIPVLISQELLAFRVRDLTNYIKIVDDLKNSEAYNKVLFTDSQIPLVVMDAETHQFTDCNNAAIKIYGFSTRDEVLGRSPADFSSDYQYNGTSSRKLAGDKINEALDKGAIRFEWLHQRPNGELWDAEVHLMSFMHKGRRLLQFSLRDITDRKKAIEALIENEVKYKTLFESANDAIFLMDKDSFIDCNALTLQIFGTTSEQIINSSPDKFSPEYQPDGRLSKDKAIEKITNALSGEPQFFEWVHKRMDGINFDAEVSLNRVLIKGNYYLIAIVRDISERKKTEKVIRESQEKFNVISRNSNDVIWIRDLNLRFIYISPSCEKVLGYSVEEAMELTFDQITTPEYISKVSQIFDEELELEGKPGVDPSRMRVLEVQEIRKDGSLIWTQSQTSFIRDEKGKITGILGVTRDITKQKLIEDALRESEERFRITAEKTGELIYEYKINSGEIIWSGAVEAITGFTSEEFKGIDVEKWGELIHPDDRNNAFAELEKAINSYCDYSVEYRFMRKDEEYIYVEDRGVVLPPDTSGIQRMYGTMNNISERKKNQDILQENERRLKEQNEEYIALNEELVRRNTHIAEMYNELLRAKEKAEENDRLKSAFLANISHEIRTPMNGLIGFSELIIQPNIDDTSKKTYAEIINSSCNQLLSIINDVIDISKIETNQVVVTETNVFLNQLLYNISQFFQPTAKAKNIHLEFVSNVLNQDVKIMVDEVKLNQIISNLLNNALKFTNQGKVEFGYSVQADIIEFFVKDTGIGINSKDFEAVFDRFRQVDLGITRNYGGTGLGLSISKAFVEKMGGRIWLDSKVNEGTTFYFTIPYKNVTKKEKAKLTIADKQLAIYDTNILVAEDEDVNFMYIKIVLDSLGFNVVRAENGKRAVDIFKSDPRFDLILMDIKMPVMGGIEATKIIKSINTSVPIIATTAYALSGEKDEFLAAGCDDYISKPLRPNDLMSVIKKYINR